MSLQKYIIGADPEQCPIILPFDENGRVGDWQRFGAGIMYKAEEVDIELARLREENEHLLRKANQCADERDKTIDEIVGLRHDVELLRRAVEWLSGQLMHQERAGFPCVFNWLEYTMVRVPAEFAGIIKPKEST